MKLIKLLLPMFLFVELMTCASHDNVINSVDAPPKRLTGYARVVELRAIAAMMVNENKFDEAIKSLDEALFFYPEYKDYIMEGYKDVNIGRLNYFYDKKEYYKMIPIVRGLIEDCKNCTTLELSRWYSALAVYLNFENRKEEAIPSIQKAIVLKPEDLQFRVLNFKWLIQVGDIYGAERAILESIKIRPFDKKNEYYYNLLLSEYDKFIQWESGKISLEEYTKSSELFTSP